MDNTDKYIGMLLDNRYEILERIGIGGMALVYKARCHRLNRLVAIKILKDELTDDEDFRRRFHTESQAVAMLSHPNIVAVYDVSRSNNIEYIVMELIEGITLKQYINRKGLLNWKEALHFTTQITKALSHAHSRGIIHRDIKPHNILILKDGSVKVADFGIARLLTMQNTLTQEALGSVHYISPEQAKGGQVDARSDIYSVGVVMYEMLTSRLPFDGDSAVSVALQHISAIPLMPRDINPDIPEGIESITMHAMEADLSLRFTTTDEMLADLEEFRKNPAIRFDYSQSTLPLDDTDALATRKVPTGAIVKAERTIPKPIRPKKIELTRDEYRVSNKKASRTGAMIGVFSIILFLIIVSALMWKFFVSEIFNPQSNDMVTNPNFVGMVFDVVSQDPEYTKNYNFLPPTYEHDDKYPEGYIITQIRPQANRPQKIPSGGLDVELVVSLGKEEPILMPQLVGRNYRDAEFELDSLGLGLDIRIDYVPSDEVTRDYIIDTVPQEGVALLNGSTVYLTCSTGPEIKMVIVPEVVNLKLSAAIMLLQSRDLVPDAVYVDDHAEKDTVIFQTKLGEEVPIYTEIKLQVSKGPPETPPPEETGDPDDPPETSPPDETPDTSHTDTTPDTSATPDETPDTTETGGIVLPNPPGAP